jgi:hypothetical protein
MPKAAVGNPKIFEYRLAATASQSISDDTEQKLEVFSKP